MRTWLTCAWTLIGAIALAQSVRQTPVVLAEHNGLDWDLALMSADGSRLEPIPSPGVENHSPSWSSDGRRIAFYSSETQGLFVIDIDGRNRRPLLTPERIGPDRDPSWSPDGGSIAFHSFRRDGTGVYLVDPDGENLRFLAISRYGRPGWSPDGQRIGHTRGNGHLSLSDIFTMNTTGGDVRNLTKTLSASENNPRWSSDGRRIAYERAENVPVGVPPVTDVWVMNADGTEQVDLTAHPAWDLEPIWMPGRDRIVFRSTRNGSNHLFVMNADGQNVDFLTDARIGTTSYDWYDPAYLLPVSPVGKRATTWGWLKRMTAPPRGDD
ncbi:MAG: hypothetical protein O3A46_15720 [Candidatus Poribacteria bacterium]|nr:hypothetical protein [Candidatus Poribacteria bacterium]